MRRSHVRQTPWPQGKITAEFSNVYCWKQTIQIDLLICSEISRYRVEISSERANNCSGSEAVFEAVDDWGMSSRGGIDGRGDCGREAGGDGGGESRDGDCARDGGGERIDDNVREGWAIVRLRDERRPKVGDEGCVGASNIVVVSFSIGSEAETSEGRSMCSRPGHLGHSETLSYYISFVLNQT